MKCKELRVQLVEGVKQMALYAALCSLLLRTIKFSKGTDYNVISLPTGKSVLKFK